MTLQVTINNIKVSVEIPENTFVWIGDSLYTFSEGKYYREDNSPFYNSSYFELVGEEWERNNSRLVRSLFASPVNNIALTIDEYTEHDDNESNPDLPHWHPAYGLV